MGLFVKIVSPAYLALAVITAQPALAQSADTSFFLTSNGIGNGGNLGGLAGADNHCQTLAQAAGIGAKTWRAYLSTQAADGQPAVNARDRIGKGPWLNAKLEQVAASVDDLHSANNKLGKQTSLTEKGEVVNGSGDTPNSLAPGGACPGRAPSVQDERLLDQAIDPVLREVDDECDGNHPHQPVDLVELAANDLDQDPADEASPNADRDVVGQRHQDDRQQSREPVLDVGYRDVLDEGEHQVAHQDKGRGGRLGGDDPRYG